MQILKQTDRQTDRQRKKERKKERKKDSLFNVVTLGLVLRVEARDQYAPRLS